uniref:RuBisCO large subunit-binding protein subunit beta n=1 Tax=Arundo donax TaxID=35708 RepID=A0A0A9DF97_ARUDO
MAAGIIDPTKVCGPVAFLSFCLNISWLVLQRHPSMLVYLTIGFHLGSIYATTLFVDLISF